MEVPTPTPAQIAVSLFGSGFLQVLLVSANAWQIAHEKYVGAFIIAFAISLCWSWNVRKIAFGSFIDRLWYCLGAAFGCLGGMGLTNFFYG